MIKICCKRNYLAEWEKIKYAKALSAIIKQLKKFRVATKYGIEIDYLIIMK